MRLVPSAATMRSAPISIQNISLPERHPDASLPIDEVGIHYSSILRGERSSLEIPAYQGALPPFVLVSLSANGFEFSDD